MEFKLALETPIKADEVIELQRPGWIGYRVQLRQGMDELYFDTKSLTIQAIDKLLDRGIKVTSVKKYKSDGTSHELDPIY